MIATLAVLAATAIEGIFHWQIDGFMGLAVAVFILYSGVVLAKQTVSPLLGEKASPELQSHIEQVLRGNSRVLGWHDLMVHDYGPGQRFASLHVEMDQKEDPLVCHEIIDDMERLCLEKHNIHLVIHYDPVVTDDPEMDRLKQLICDILAQYDPRLSIHDFRMVRGTGHSNLIFDLVLPHEMSDRRQQIKEVIDSGLNQAGPCDYRTVITFDLAN